MNLSKILETLITLVALGASALALWKSRKTLPKEVAQIDANAAKTYAEVADLAGKQVAEALKRIEDLEDKGAEFESRINELQTVVLKRDKCIDTLNADIQRRDALIKEWTRGIRILLAQLMQAQIIPAWSPKESDFPSSE